MDILNHLPRSTFSDKQLELLCWMLEINGVDNVPSVKQMKAQQTGLQERIGLKTIEKSGAFGHPYFVNDLGEIIAQVRLQSVRAQNGVRSDLLARKWQTR